MCFSIEMTKSVSFLEKRFSARRSDLGFERVEKIISLQEIIPGSEFHALLGSSSTKKNTKLFKMPGDDGKIFPNYFTNTIISQNKDNKVERLVTPMRYRVRPNYSDSEIPTKFNVFNARLDSLESAKTWQGLFMRRHALVAFERFYEWVEDKGHKRLISFFPEDKEVLWAPCLWDDWSSHNGEVRFQSFAIITDDPPKEISLMGHDRCPIFFKEEYINEWLNPQKSNLADIYGILKSRQKVHYQHQWAY